MSKFPQSHIRSVFCQKGDGNCLFRSLADQLYNNPARFNEIRQGVVDFIELNKEDFEPFIVDESFDAFCKNMREDGTWGGKGNLFFQFFRCHLNSSCFNNNIFVSIII